MSASNRYLVIKALPLDTGSRHINTTINKKYPIGVVVDIINFTIDKRYLLTRNEIKTCFKELP